jgi:hypothetical protein
LIDLSAPMEIPEGANNPYVVPVKEQGYFERGMDGQGCIVATIGDYAAIRQLIADLASEGIEATVPETVSLGVISCTDLGEHRTRLASESATTKQLGGVPDLRFCQSNRLVTTGSAFS